MSRHVTRVLLFICLVSSPLLAAGDLASIAKAYSEAAPSGASHAVENLHYTTGHLDLLLTSGRAVALKSGDRILGFYFKGTGTFTYTSVEPLEFAVMKFNLKRTSFTPKIDATMAVISGSIEEAIVWTNRTPELTGTAGAALDDDLGKMLQIDTLDLYPPARLRVAAAAFEDPASPVTAVELTSGKDHLVHAYDPLDTHEEKLVRRFLEHSPIKDVKNVYLDAHMSSQAIGRSRRQAPIPRFRLEDLTYTLTNTSGENMSLDVTETLVATASGERTLTFDIQDLFYKQAGTVVLPRRAVVKSVIDEAGHTLSAFSDRGELLVGLAQPSTKGQPFKLTFHIDGDVLIGPGGDTYWQVDSIFPMPVDLNALYYTVHSKIVTRQPNMPIAPGETVSRRTEGDMNVLETKIDRPIDNAFAMAGHYTSRERSENGITIRVWTYAMTNEQSVKKLTDLAFGIIKYYEWFLGPFPFKEFNIVQINDYGYGVAPPATMWITNEAFRPMGDEDAQETNDIYSEGINERFAHEIAHQYWGHATKTVSREERWLDEAFAEYTAALFIRKAKGEGAYNKLVNNWKSYASQARDAGTIPTSYDVSTPGDSRTQFLYSTSLRYFKGAYLLSRIHKEIGDEQFLTFMKSYQKNFLFKFGGTEHVIGILGAITKKDWKPFFEQYYWGTAMP